MQEYYESKIEILYDKYIELFKNVLSKHGTKKIETETSLFQLANMITVYYPELKNKVNRVLYIFNEEKDSEEKLESLLNLYKICMEETKWEI